MVLGAAGAAWWYWSTDKELAKKQGEPTPAPVLLWPSCTTACLPAAQWRMLGACRLFTPRPCCPLDAPSSHADEAVQKFDAHGEKAEYGASFKESVQEGPHFPGIPTTDTNTGGGHAGGAKP